ncbi:MAG: hypothetical protein V1928_03670 [Parcubacteria group bacterium]
MNLFNRILLILIIVVFASGLLIYGWNYMHGRDLSKPPEFKASSFPDLNDYFKMEEVAKNLFGDELNGNNTLATGNGAGQVAQPKNSYVYFKNSFRLQTAGQTNELIKSFLNDFPELKKSPVENLLSRKIVNIDLPALNKSLLTSKIKRNKEAALFDEKTGDLQFKQEKYQNEVLIFLETISPEIILKTKFPDESDYIARISCDPKNAAVAPELENLKNNFRDVAAVQ